MQFVPLLYKDESFGNESETGSSDDELIGSYAKVSRHQTYDLEVTNEIVCKKRDNETETRTTQASA